MNSQSIIVPKISTLPVHEPRARAIVRWLVRKNIIEEALTTCGRTGNGMAHAIADCEAIICGSMGAGAYESMRQLNIKPVVTDLRKIDDAIQSYLTGRLQDRTDLLH